LSVTTYQWLLKFCGPKSQIIGFGRKLVNAAEYWLLFVMLCYMVTTEISQNYGQEWGVYCPVVFFLTHMGRLSLD